MHCDIGGRNCGQRFAASIAGEPVGRPPGGRGKVEFVIFRAIGPNERLETSVAPEFIGPFPSCHGRDRKIGKVTGNDVRQFEPIGPWPHNRCFNAYGRAALRARMVFQQLSHATDDDGSNGTNAQNED